MFQSKQICEDNICALIDLIVVVVAVVVVAVVVVVVAITMLNHILN